MTGPLRFLKEKIVGELRVLGGYPKPYNLTWTPKVCRIMAFWAIFKGFGPLFYR